MSVRSVMLASIQNEISNLRRSHFHDKMLMALQISKFSRTFEGVEYPRLRLQQP